MLFKLSIKNIKKSIKDYTIYFMTLILGVAIFYMFNSLDSQEAMMNVSNSTRQIIKLMVTVLGMVSVFVSVVLAFLIIYANNFLIKRRKKEFGVYMTLGMGRRQISRILFGETLIIGTLSLCVGLLIGVFGSQLMSILVVKLFEADLSQFTFVFSKMAFFKTLIYFGIMYLIVIIFNAVAVSRCKLIELINAERQGEKVKLKNPVFSVFVFLISIGMLAFAYYNVTVNIETLNQNRFVGMIGIGIVATFLFFWSLSGFLLRLVQTSKNLYLRNLNVFILRQVNSKVNTTVCSMSIICLMLFLTICILSGGFSINQSMNQTLKEMVTADIYLESQGTSDMKTISQTLEDCGWDLSKFEDGYEEIPVYEVEQITWKSTLGDYFAEVQKQFPNLRIGTKETLVEVSDYNKIAAIYGEPQYSIGDGEYIMLCDYEVMKELRDPALEMGTEIVLDGTSYRPKYESCQEGYLMMSSQQVNMGIILLPDGVLDAKYRAGDRLVANYRAGDEDGKKAIEEAFAALAENPQYKADFQSIQCEAVTKIALYESSVGLGAMVTFIAIYLGIIFLVSSAAILALKELSESSDNQSRYLILRKIGVDEKMLSRALFIQIGIFFLIPLVLACVHSVFGIQVANTMLKSMGMKNLLKPIIITACTIVAIYGGYFIATYMGSKRIIKGNQ